VQGMISNSVPLDIAFLFNLVKLHLKHKGISVATMRYTFIVLPLIIVRHFITSICFMLDDIFFPRYTKISVDTTIFCIGAPRSGTTFFLELLAKNDDFSSMKFWECLHAPSIVEKLFWLQVDKVDRFFGSPLYKLMTRIENALFGDFYKIHKTGLFKYEEDAQILGHSGNNPFFLFFFPFEEVEEFFTRFDEVTTRHYRERFIGFYKKCIQKHLYVFGEEKTYVSKNPFFSFYIKSLKESFSDARFIYMARTPYEVVPSAISLVGFYEKSSLYFSSVVEISDRFVQVLKRQYSYPLEILDFEKDPNNAMVLYPDLMASPKKITEQVLEQLGVKLSGKYRDILADEEKEAKQFVSENRYSLGKYNIDENDIRNSFQMVCKQLGFPE
jgi:hypothetical protein